MKVEESCLTLKSNLFCLPLFMITFQWYIFAITLFENRINNVFSLQHFPKNSGRKITWNMYSKHSLPRLFICLTWKYRISRNIKQAYRMKCKLYNHLKLNMMSLDQMNVVYDYQKLMIKCNESKMSFIIN